jgi:hypothetical protein
MQATDLRLTTVGETQTKEPLTTHHSPLYNDEVPLATEVKSLISLMDTVECLLSP